MKSSFQNIHKLTIFLPFDAQPQSYTISTIKKLRPLHIIAIDINGKLIEFKTTKPMDYIMVRLK